jgi:glycosyltransferase involved in cell wall biosynthesis
MRPDIVFTASVDAQVIGHFVAARAKAPHVTVEHGGAGLPRAFHRRLLVRLIAPRVERVVAVSSSQLDALQDLGYHADRITVIPNGIPAPSPARPRAAVRAELGIGDHDVLALLVATLRPEKRAHVFVEALRRAHAREPRLRGVIAGDGPEFERVRNLEAATSGVVHVLGERSDVPDLIGAADLVCLTSAFEALPITALEAMALSRPLVTTNVGGMPEAVTDGRTGTLVAPDDVDAFAEALVALASAPSLRRAMGDAANSAYLERFTLEAMVECYVDLFGELADRGTPQAGAVCIELTRE